MTVNVKIEAVGPCRKTLHLEVAADDVRKEYDEVLGMFATQARIKGFRPGKAPIAMVERQHRVSILKEVRDRMLPEAYQQAIKQEALKPVSVVNVGLVDVDPVKPMTVAVTVDVEPEFTLPDYRTLPLTRQTAAVTDEEVAKALDNLRLRQAKFEERPDRVAAEGDIVQVDYTGTMDGQPVESLLPGHAELNAGKDFWVMLGGPDLLPGMGKALVGMRVGETRTVSVAFPEGYAVKEAVGRKAEYSVVAHAVRERILPPMDQAFCEAMGVENETALLRVLRENLQTAAEQNEIGRLKDEAIRWLLANTAIETLPKSVVDEQARHIITDTVTQHMRQGNSREEIEQHRDDLFAGAAQTSADRVKVRYILEHIADAEKVTVSEADLAQHINAMAARYRISREQVREELEKRQALDDIRGQVRIEKTLDLLIARHDAAAHGKAGAEGAKS